MTAPETETVIGARSTTFFRLLCSGRFKVPWHQRRYDWTADHVEELLQDIDDAINADRHCYFLGTMILVKSAPEEWRINDGQQRIVTLSLICACLRSLFTDQKDSQRAHLALRMLFDIDENRTQALEQIDRLTPRVTPPRDDKTRYNLMIRGRSIGANGKLTQAWRRIDSFVVGMGLDRSRRFFDFLLQNVEVARLDIPDSVDPNSVYETINSRGKRLDDLGLDPQPLVLLFQRRRRRFATRSCSREPRRHSYATSRRLEVHRLCALLLSVSLWLSAKERLLSRDEATHPVPKRPS